MMPNILSEALLISSEKAYRWISPLTLAMDRFEINSRKRKAAFLTFASHESGRFERTQVNLRELTPRRIQALWPSLFNTVEDARQYRGDEALANVVFANCNGNGSYESGDGARFRPRGLIPLCGRSSYERASFALEFDFVSQPNAMAEDHWAAMTAGWYWRDESFNELADKGDIDSIGRILGRRHLTDGRPEFDDIRVAYHEALQVLAD